MYKREEQSGGECQKMPSLPKSGQEESSLPHCKGRTRPPVVASDLWPASSADLGQLLAMEEQSCPQGLGEIPGWEGVGEAHMDKTPR